ncbi:hypothetical protein KEJ19_04695 [Candidatus Bathyarchaeota archaeon]|nr:hypothetical protein [Candidatus Bathyarchaeota archaeon]
MAEAELEMETFGEGSFLKLLKSLLPRIAKAVLWTAFYILLDFLLRRIFPYEALPMELITTTRGFILILTFFTLAGNLSSGTIFEYIFGFAKGISLIAFTWLAFCGGILTLTLPSETSIPSIYVTVDFRIFLGMYILIELLGIATNILRAIEFLSKKVEAP